MSISRSVASPVARSVSAPIAGGSGGGGPVVPGVDNYLRPATTDKYLRPDGTSLFKRPA